MMDKCNAALERHERAAHARLSARGCQGHVDEKAWLRVNTALVWCEEKSSGGRARGSEVLGRRPVPGAIKLGLRLSRRAHMIHLPPPQLVASTVCCVDIPSLKGKKVPPER